MTIEQQIINYLSANPDPIDDDTLTEILGLKRRQQANDRCRKLEMDGLVERKRINGKIHNIWIGGKIFSQKPVNGYHSITNINIDDYL